MRYFNLILCFLCFTVFTSRAQIGGTTVVCENATTTLFCTSPVGGTWSSSDPSVATIDATGVVTGLTTGTTTIAYILTPTVFTTVVTVNSLPAPITGSPLTICVGNSVTLTSATPGGTWVSGDLGTASVGITNGIVTGLVAGTAAVNITYIAPNTCSRSVNVTVNPVPSTVSGSSTVCAGNSTTLTNSVLGGTWVSGNPAVASVNSAGSVTGTAAGTVIISYQLGTGCSRVKYMTVNALPAAITGASNVCSGSFTTLSSATSGGAWSASSSAFTINATTGVVTGLAAGAGTVTYTLSGTGCATSRPMTVNAMPASISGTATLCQGGTTALSNSVAGGTWLSDAPSVATVGTGGGSATTVTGIATGTATIKYITGTGCLASRAVTVQPAPSAGTISGPSVVCTGTTINLTSTASAGFWTSSNPSVATISIVGLVTGVTAGSTTVTYSVTTGCGTAYTTAVITSSVAPSPITGATTLCNGATTTLYNGVSGGVWTSSNTAVAAVAPGTGVVSGVSAGSATISYSFGGGCYAATNVTVNVAPGPITGSGNLCVGDISPLANSVLGGAWSTSTPSVAIISIIGSSTGVVSGLAAGTSTINYAIASCYSSLVVTVNSLPAVSASATADACGGGYRLAAGGGVSYSWNPTIGLSCATCVTTNVLPLATTVYTVSATNTEGCTSDATVTVSGNRIYGHISFSAAAPAVPDLKVWLVQYNPTDSSITATDSVMTCMDGTQPFFQFDSKPAGNYMVKAKLLSSIAGTSDYIPTYGGSTPNWYDAATIAHTSNADAQDINMVFGTVPAGSGFISGYVYSGAGKGTSGTIPEAGMLVYLKNAATGKVVTYTYTDASGAYSFGNLGLGNYIVYPEEYDYYTTPPPAITISHSVSSVTAVSFKKHTVLHTISPYDATSVGSVTAPKGAIAIFPNPANNYISIQWSEQQSGSVEVSITDMTGRVVLATAVNVTGAPSHMDIATLKAGVYFINIKSEGAQHSSKLVVAK